MNKTYVISIRDEKIKVTLIDENTIIIDGEEYIFEHSNINNFSNLFKLDEKSYEITSNKIGKDKKAFLVNGHYFEVTVRTDFEERAVEFLKNKQKNIRHDVVVTPMPGLLLRINKKIGEIVEMGETIAVLEAMKMENDIKAPSSGKIKEIFVSEGSSLEKNIPILTIE